MKKTLRFLPALLVGLIFAFGACACSDSDDEEEITVKEQLPGRAQEFINNYFTGYEIVRVVKNNVVPVWYEVNFRGGGEIKFDAEGLWYEVDANHNVAIPTGFYPAAIDSYIATHYSGCYIQEIDRTPTTYKVDLNNDVDLLFNAEGDFVQ